MNNKNEEKKKKVDMTIIACAVIFVFGLILLGIASSYAYYKLEVSSSNTTATINVQTDCIDISFTNDTDATYGLSYNYPITDTFAMNNVKPITLKVKNNCTNNTGNVPYALTLASIHDESNIISDNKIRYSVKKQKNSGTEEIFKTNNYLNTNAVLPNGTQAYDLLTNELANKNILIANTSPYVIDSGELANNDEIIYKIYLWVDYYEGDSQMYEAGEHQHDTTYDGTTKNQKFKSIASILVNTITTTNTES